MTHFNRMVIRTIDPSQQDMINAFKKGICPITNTSIYSRNRFDHPEVLGEYDFIFDENTMSMKRFYQVNPDDICLSINKLWIENNEIMASIDIYNDDLELDNHIFNLRIMVAPDANTTIAENTSIESIVIIIVAVDILKKK